MATPQDPIGGAAGDTLPASMDQAELQGRESGFHSEYEGADAGPTFLVTCDR
jgi:hypothetical protein